MKTSSQDIRTTDDLDLTIETLKDLTPTATQADVVRGGMTSRAQGCYCGTM